MLVQAQSIIVRMITIIWWQQWRSWWWLGWWWWWLAPNIDGDGMLLQVQDRKYWSRPTPTTMCTTCNTVQKYKLFCTLTFTKKYKIFCTPCTNIYKKVQNIEVHKCTTVLLLCSVHTSLPQARAQCARHFKSTNNTVQKYSIYYGYAQQYITKFETQFTTIHCQALIFCSMAISSSV